MTDLRAFELREEFDLETLNGATVAVGPNAYMFDVRQALEDGDGVIVTSDPGLMSALASSPVVQAGPVPTNPVVAESPEGYEPPVPTPPLFIPQGPVGEVAAEHGPDPDAQDPMQVRGIVSPLQNPQKPPGQDDGDDDTDSDDGEE